MIRLYTPKEWYSTFKNPEIIIEDNGMIYSAADYYKTLRDPLGKIDYSTGYIYGENYYSMTATPIGKIVTENGETRIYGEDYFKMGAQPIFHIRNQRVYSAEQNYKTIPMEAGYIQGTIPQNNSPAPKKKDSAKEKKPVENELVYDPDDPMVRFWVFLEKVKNVLIAVGLFLLIAFLAVFVLREAYVVHSEYYDYLAVQMFGCLLGGIVSFFKLKKEKNKTIAAGKKWGWNISNGFVLSPIYQTTGIIFWFYMMFRIVLDVGFPWYLVFLAILCVPISMLFSLIPTAITYIIVTMIFGMTIPKSERAEKTSKNNTKS